MTIEEDELKQEMEKHLQRYHSPEDAESKVDVEQLQEHVESMLRNRKTLAKLAELSQN